MRHLHAALAAFFALAAASTVRAQDRPSQAAPYGDRPNVAASRDEDRQDGRNDDRAAADPGDAAADLVRQLNLRPDQQAAFRDYQAAFAAQAQNGAAEAEEAQRLAGMTTPQRLDEAAREMERDRASFDRVAAATRRLYASLDALQRRTFDRLTAPQADADEDEGPDPRSATPPPRD